MKTQHLRALVGVLVALSTIGSAHAVSVTVGGSIKVDPTSGSSATTGLTYGSPDPASLPPPAPPGTYDPTLNGTVVYDKTITGTAILAHQFNGSLLTEQYQLEDRVVRNSLGTLDFYTFFLGGQVADVVRTNTTAVTGSVDMGVRLDLAGTLLAAYSYSASTGTSGLSAQTLSRPTATSFEYLRDFTFPPSTGVEAAYYRSNATSFDLGGTGTAVIGENSLPNYRSVFVSLAGLAEPAPVPEPASSLLIAAGLLCLISWQRRMVGR